MRKLRFYVWKRLFNRKISKKWWAGEGDGEADSVFIRDSVGLIGVVAMFRVFSIL